MSAATVVYRNAVMLLAGVSIETQLNELTVNYASEMLDRTVFSDTTRNRRGGLFVASIEGKGFAQSGTGLIDDVMFTDVGLTTDTVAAVVFPDGVTDGSQSARGYAMIGVIETLNLGGPVGVLRPLAFAIRGAGLS